MGSYLGVPDWRTKLVSSPPSIEHIWLIYPGKRVAQEGQEWQLPLWVWELVFSPRLCFGEVWSVHSQDRTGGEFWLPMSTWDSFWEWVKIGNRSAVPSEYWILTRQKCFWGSLQHDCITYLAGSWGIGLDITRDRVDFESLCDKQSKLLYRDMHWCGSIASINYGVGIFSSDKISDNQHT
jgi:hypothetical protein